jgi:thymidylate kinase
MASIALIGPDGAGKTTLCRMLADSSLLPFKYLYMGINFSASNVSLPTTRLVTWWRGQNRDQKSGAEGTNSAPKEVTFAKNRGALRSALRLVNLLAEEWYREFVSLWYERHGYVVLYDRHFVFDFAAPDGEADKEPFSKYLHRWLLARFYPRPDLVILLDAPAEVLYARQGEFSPEILEMRRRILRVEAGRCRNFVLLDTDRPLDRVYSEVTQHVMKFLGREAPPDLKHQEG